MAGVHIYVSDTDPGIGRMDVRVLQSPPVGQSQMDRILHLEGIMLDLKETIRDLSARAFMPLEEWKRIGELERRVTDLESRTWWSMLKSDFIKWIKGVKRGRT